MNVGTLAYATDQGLGILAKSFVDHGIVTDVLVVRHASRPTHTEWYPRSDQMDIRRLDADRIRQFAKTMDVMLFFETPFDWNVLPYCRSVSVRTVLMPMHECMPAKLPYEPDIYLCPSLIEYEHYAHQTSVFLPIPVDVPWRLRTNANVFVHNAGFLGLRGRNGTRELLQAVQHIRSPIRLIVRSQTSKIKRLIPKGLEEDDRVTVHIGGVSEEELWRTGDVFVFPEKFNGLSLPLQEARAAGMLVMATDRFPMNSWLPTAPLIPVDSYTEVSIARGWLPFQEASVDPVTIASKIDEWYGRDISSYSSSGKHWAAEHTSWKVLKPLYLDVLSGNVKKAQDCHANSLCS